MPSRTEVLLITVAVSFLVFGVWAVKQLKHSYINEASEVVVSEGEVYWVNHETGIACKQLPQKIEGQIVWGREGLCGLAILDVLVLKSEKE